MQPSSLIFLVLIAIWAAYLLQHWVRRREHLATARSVDRFSDAMRVLDRRGPLPEPDLSAPRPRSYATSPARPSRPEVVVKRAQSPMPPVPRVPEAPVRPTWIFHVLASVSARRVRGLSLLASLSLFLVVSALAAFSVLPWWSVLVVVAALTADVVWLRQAAVSERAAGSAGVKGRGGASGSDRPAARPSGYFDTGSEALFEADSDPVFGSDSDPTMELDPGTELDPGMELNPTMELPVPGPAARVEPVDLVEPVAQVDPSAWEPVPVPPPTYTLKAKAAEPVAVPTTVTEPASIGPWSLDGLVYDCELDELVESRSATGA